MRRRRFTRAGPRRLKWAGTGSGPARRKRRSPETPWWRNGSSRDAFRLATGAVRRRNDGFRSMPLPPFLRKILRFAVVGLTVMLFFMGLNWLFGRWVGPTAAFLLAYPPALVLHYSLNKWWTFGCARTDTTRQVSEYLVMVAITFVVQYGFFWLAHEQLGLPGWLSAGVANAAQMALSFVIMQRRVFRTGVDAA